MADTSKTVSVTTLRFHTLFGEPHEIGEVYDAAEEHLDNLLGQGMVRRTADDVSPAAPPSEPAE